jgi:hypothetical protein
VNFVAMKGKCSTEDLFSTLKTSANLVFASDGKTKKLQKSEIITDVP